MPTASQYVILALVATVPSLLWLIYFLRKDCHPEPQYMIARTFLMAVILSPLAIIFQLLALKAAGYLGFELSQRDATFLLWAAFVEEVVKFYAVRIIVLRSPEFDEPVDTMIYMVTAALGFAAMENILLLSRILPDGLDIVVRAWILRFAGATLLHALSSAMLGYFLAMAWFFRAHHNRLLVGGLMLATMFHFAFNMFLTAWNADVASLSAVTLLLVTMAFFVSFLFDKIKERRSDQATLAQSMF